MDRVLVSDAALLQSTDILNTNKFGMVAQAFLSSAILGVPTTVDGLACTPTTPASLQVTVGVGSIYASDQVDATAYNDLGVDSNTIVKQGILYNPVTLTITPPTTAGYSQVFLVQAILQDVDSGTSVVSYFNPAILTNPQAQPFAGPNNSGQSQFTIRSCLCAIALKRGVAAATGTQTTPAPDAGYTGLYAITVTNGQATISSTNIVQLPNAPFIDPGAKLPQIPTSSQYNKWTYVVDTGSPSVIVVKTTPNLISYGPAGLMLLVKAAAAPTGATTINVDALGPQSVVNIDGSAIAQNQWATGSVLVLLWDGSRFQYISSTKQPGAPTYLQSSLTWYLNASTGNDTLYDGTSPTVNGTHGPWKTLQHALNQVPLYNLNGQNITINVANGTYNTTSPTVAPGANGSGAVIIQGNHSSPGSVLFFCSAGSCLDFLSSGFFQIDGVTIGAPNAAPADAGNGINSIGGATIVNVINVAFNACAGAHMEAAIGGNVSINGNITINGGANIHIYASSNAIIVFGNPPTVSPTLTVTAPVTINTFAQATALSSINGSFYGGITGAGNVTGKSYFAQLNGIINSNSSAGVNAFPGTPGTVSSGGQYT
jgi:hypothetical protein